MGDQVGRGEIAAEVAKQGYICMTFDLRGHGMSEGNMEELTTENFMHDVEAAYDTLAATKGIDPKKITVYGNSFGSYLAAVLVKRRAVQNIALQAPANYPDDILEKPVATYTGTPPISTWRQKPIDENETESLRAMHAFPGNVLVIESELDTFVPHQTTENYLEAVADKKHLEHALLKGAPHSLKDPLQRAKCRTILQAWLQKNQEL